MLAFEGVAVHIADGDDIAASGKRVGGVAIAFAADADTGDVDAVIGTEDASHEGEREGGGAGGEGGAAQEGATVEVIWLFVIHTHIQCSLNARNAWVTRCSSAMPRCQVWTHPTTVFFMNQAET